MKKKKFDCVKMKWEGGARIYEEVKDMTREQELAYWREKSDKLRIEMAEAKRKQERQRPKLAKP